MRKKYLKELWAEIFENYYCGMSQRELEKKYSNVDIRTIQRYCKSIMISMFTNPSSTIRKSWVEIKKEIEKIINEN